MTRCVLTVTTVRISFVLRLDQALLRAGELSGDIEEVESGRRQGIRGPQDIVDFCSAVGAVADGLTVIRAHAGTTDLAPVVSDGRE